MKFSERLGINKPKVEIQNNYMDDDLRNSLWSVITIYLMQPLNNYYTLEESNYNSVIRLIWFHFFKKPLDEIPYRASENISLIRNYFFKHWEYHEVYDFIEFLANIENTEFDNKKFKETCNKILKRELSAYRFVKSELIPITNQEEIDSIENAIDVSEKRNYKGVNVHLIEALKKLSDKQNPDYRNSIKESISAVESICKRITGDEKAELGKALKELKKKFFIHPALEQGFLKIYGYTSDGDGIRHALLDETKIEQEDALFMLVSCSAFINYLITKSEK